MLHALTWIGAAALAGLVGSPHCVGMCGGFASASAPSLDTAGAYHLGRALTYATLGAIAGGLGATLPLPGTALALLSGAVMTVFALSLAGLLPPLSVALPGVHGLATRALQRGGLLGALGLGAATGLLPCGLVYAALALPLASGSAGLGALTMLAFGLGTVPLLATASVGLRRITAHHRWARRALAASVLAAGWWSLGVRAGWTADPVRTDALEGPSAPTCH